MNLERTQFMRMWFCLSLCRFLQQKTFTDSICVKRGFPEYLYLIYKVKYFFQFSFVFKRTFLGSRVMFIRVTFTSFRIRYVPKVNWHITRVFIINKSLIQFTLINNYKTRALDANKNQINYEI